MKYTFPTETYGQNAVVMLIDEAFAPIVAGKLKELANEHLWIDTTNWRSAYNAVAEMLLMQNGIVESVDRLYRLVDASLNGTTYTASSDTPPVVTPAIPAAPGAITGISAGLRKQLLDAQGILPSSWPFGLGSKPATTADMVKALKASSPSEITRAKETITGLAELAQGATVLGTIGQFLEDGGSLTAEGGLLMTTLVATAGQIAASAKLESMMWRLIDTLDGGGLGAPSTNVIAELVKANETLVAKLDRLITSLDGGATPAPSGNILSDLDAINTKLV